MTALPWLLAVLAILLSWQLGRWYFIVLSWRGYKRLLGLPIVFAAAIMFAVGLNGWMFFGLPRTEAGVASLSSIVVGILLAARHAPRRWSSRIKQSTEFMKRRELYLRVGLTISLVASLLLADHTPVAVFAVAAISLPLGSLPVSHVVWLLRMRRQLSSLELKDEIDGMTDEVKWVRSSSKWLVDALDGGSSNSE